MREPLHHLTPAEIRKREDRLREWQIMMQRDVEYHTITACINDPHLREGTFERAIAENYLAAWEEDNKDIDYTPYTIDRLRARLNKSAKENSRG